MEEVNKEVLNAVVEPLLLQINNMLQQMWQHYYDLHALRKSFYLGLLNNSTPLVESAEEIKDLPESGIDSFMIFYENFSKLERLICEEIEYLKEIKKESF